MISAGGPCQLTAMRLCEGGLGAGGTEGAGQFVVAVGLVPVGVAGGAEFVMAVGAGGAVQSPGDGVREGLG